MNEKETLELTIEVWQYLADHPDFRFKYNLPDTLWERIMGMVDECPLCEYYRAIEQTPGDPTQSSCGNCILFYGGQSCYAIGREYSTWKYAEETKNPNQTRKRAALAIVRRCQKMLGELE